MGLLYLYLIEIIRANMLNAVSVSFRGISETCTCIRIGFTSIITTALRNLIRHFVTYVSAAILCSCG